MIQTMILHKSGHYGTYNSSYYTSHLGTNNSSKNGTYKIKHNSEYKSNYTETCFIKNTKILLADGHWKNIEDFVGGEKVVGLTGINNIIFSERSELKEDRILYTLSSKKIIFTGEHNFWIRTPEGVERTGVVNYNDFMGDAMFFREIEQGTFYSMVPYVIKPNEYVDFATVDSWSSEKFLINKNLLNQWNPKIKVYSLAADGDHTMIANGYVVSAWLTEADGFNYKDAKWVSKNILKKIIIEPLKTYHADTVEL